MKVILLFIVMNAFGVIDSCAQQDTLLTKQQWLEDLSYTVKILIDQHPDIYYRLSEDEFRNFVTQAEQKINASNTNEECFTAIRHVVASIQDGHTRIINPLAAYNSIFPVRLYEFSDGVFITGITNACAKYIGAKVMKIGLFSSQEALKRAGELAFADNEFGRKCQAPVLAITCSYAFGLGITQSVDSLSLEIETAGGKHEIIYLPRAQPSGQNNMISTMDMGPTGIPFTSAFTGTQKELPLYMRHLDGNHNYWFEHDLKRRVLYMQFNLVIDQQDENFEQFYQRLFNYYDEHAKGIDKFILDLRFNGGGNGRMVLPFINEIIKRDSINRLGSLYVLIGRRSFSAAVLLISEMMNHTNVLLVGEPAGAAQNMFSDIRGKGTLPNSGAALLLSTAYFNIAWPANKKYFIAPHYPVQFSSSDFFAGRDPVIEAVMANKVKALETVFNEKGPRAAMNYFNEININWGLHTNELSILPYQFPITNYNIDEGYLNNLGYELLENHKSEDSQAAFELNTLLFPESFNVWDSLAECYMKQGDIQNAIKYYRKSLGMNSENTNAMDKLRELNVSK